MILSRRSFIASGAAFAAQSGRLFAQTADDGFTILTMRPVAAQLMEGDRPATRLQSLSGSWPPPVLSARQGEEMKIRFVNELDRPAALHWYGIRGPSEMMSISVAPGADNAFECVFTPPDAGTFWLSPVADVSRQREMGLYALVVAVGTAAYAAGYERDSMVVPDVAAALDLLRAELRPHDVVLVKASRSAGLERVAAGLLDECAGAVE